MSKASKAPRDMRAEEGEPMPKKPKPRPPYESPLVKAVGDGKCQRCGDPLLDMGAPNFLEATLKFDRIMVRDQIEQARGIHAMGLPLQIGEVLGNVEPPKREEFKKVTVKICGFCWHDLLKGFFDIMESEPDRSAKKNMVEAAEYMRDQKDNADSLERKGRLKRLRREAGG